MLEIKHLCKTYITKGAPPVHALADVSVKLESTGMVFILGKSGSGKSTFLNVVGGLDKYDSGEIIIKGKSSSSFQGSDFDSYRNTYLGFIFQEYNLINEFTVGQNIALALELQNRKSTPADVEQILQLVDLGGHADRLPMQISGGQRQRVAIARALIKNPEIIMADEPTGALDSNTGAQIFQTLQDLSKTRLVIIVSHDRDFAERYGDRIIEFMDGHIVSDMIKRGEGFIEEVAESGDVERVEEIISAAKTAGLGAEHMKILDGLLSEKKQVQVQPKRKQRKGSFVNTREEDLNLEDGSHSPFKLIKSKLPQRNALKMATSSMKHKRVRLAFSILLSIIAVTLLGFSSVVGSFSERTIIKSMMRDYKYDYMSVAKYIKADTLSGSRMDIAFSESEIRGMKELTDGAVAEFYNVQANIETQTSIEKAGYNANYFSQGVNGIVLGDLQKMGLNIPSVYGRYPEKYDEILLPNYLAETFMIYGMKYVDDNLGTSELKPTDIKKINDILSYTIRLDGIIVPVKIVGIVNFPIERYKDLKMTETVGAVEKAIKDEFEERRANEISYIYGTEELAQYMNYYTWGDYGMDYGLDGIKKKTGYDTAQIIGGNYSEFSSSYGPFLALSDAVTPRWPIVGGYSSMTYLGADGSTSPTEPKKGEVIIDLSAYLAAVDFNKNGYDSNASRFFGLSSAELVAYNESLGLLGKEITVQSFADNLYKYDKKYYEFYEGKFEIIGIYSSPYSYTLWEQKIGVFCDEDFLSISSLAIPDSYLVHLKDHATMEKFVDNYVGEFKISQKGLVKGFSYRIPFSDQISMFGIMFDVMSKVFFVMSMVFCVFAALLLLNFISASVSLKKKEIGILRAIGARKIDVVSIFLWEGVIIGIVIMVLSVLAVFAVVVLFNNIIGAFISMSFTLLVFGIAPIALMALICFATIALASILPARRVAALKPMDAIRSV